MELFCPDIWTFTRPFKVLGLPIGARMTVVRLADGRLFVHSPIRPNPSREEDLKTLGKVGFVVAPNCFHHLFAEPFLRAHPEARLSVAPGLPKKRPDLPHATVLGDEAPSEWKEEMDQKVVKGIPASNEVVFFHRKSKTLILTDLAFNIRDEASAFARFVFRFLNDSYNRLRCTRFFRLIIRDREAFRKSIQEILGWDFDRIILSHGHLIHGGGKEAFRKAFEGI
jgi:uncharacterized protein DUF4336